MARILPFPFLEKIKVYARAVQVAYGPRFYFIRCTPKPSVSDLKAVITSKQKTDATYLYIMLCEDGHVRNYETPSGRFEAADNVVITLKDSEIIGMRKQGETKVEAVILNRPRILR